MSQKTAPVSFCNNFVKLSCILIIFGKHIPKESSPIRSIFYIFHKVESREPAEVLTAQHASTGCAHNRQAVRREMPDFIIAPNLWLLNISDFSFVDYSILAMIREWICQHPMQDGDKLRRLIGGDLG